MALEQHIESLKKRHMELDLKILEETAHRAPDEWLVGQLKKQKLKLKDDINRLSYAAEAA